MLSESQRLDPDQHEDSMQGQDGEAAALFDAAW